MVRQRLIGVASLLLGEQQLRATAPRWRSTKTPGQSRCSRGHGPVAMLRRGRGRVGAEDAVFHGSSAAWVRGYGGASTGLVAQLPAVARMRRCLVEEAVRGRSGDGAAAG
jgi:hypothetical protein